MKEWSLIMQVMTHLLNILNHWRKICMTTTRPTMLESTLHHRKWWIPFPVHQSILQPLLAHLKRILCHASSGRQRRPSTNLTNSSTFLKRILILAIQSIGGWAIVLNSPTCFGLLVTFFAYLVPYCVIIESFQLTSLSQDLLWLLSVFSRGVVIQSHCDVQVFGLKPSKY